MGYGRQASFSIGTVTGQETHAHGAKRPSNDAASAADQCLNREPGALNPLLQRRALFTLIVLTAHCRIPIGKAPQWIVLRSPHM